MQRNKKFRMIDPDSYPVDIDPYQEIDTMQPPNFLNQLHDWFSNISSKMKQKTVSYKSSVGDYDNDFLKSNIGSTISIRGVTNFPSNFTKHQLKNIKWAIKNFPYMGSKKIKQQLYINQQTSDELNLNLIISDPPIYVFEITKSQHNYMLALYDAGFDVFTMAKLVLLFGKEQAKNIATRQ